MTKQLKINSAKLRNYRLEQRLTQAKISEKLNIHQTTYSKFENGKTFINLETLINVSNVLNIPFEQLIIHDTRKKNITSSTVTEEPPINIEIKELITRLNSLLVQYRVK